MTVPSNETDMERLKILYLEVLDFLHSCGGPYKTVNALACSRVLCALDAGFYYLKRKEGAITAFCSYRPLLPTELHFVPGATTSTLFITEYGNKEDHVRGMVRELRERNPNADGVAWRRDGALRHFPRQKGVR